MMERTSNSKAYRAAFDLHQTALSAIQTTPVDTLWEWYWEQAHAILDAHGGDQFVMDLLICVAEDVERQQLTQIHAGKIA